MSWPDGAIVGCGLGFCWRVFAPRWWQVGRWIDWLAFERRPHGNLEFGYPDGSKIVVRVVMSDYRVPNVPSTTATVIVDGARAASTPRPDDR